MADIRCPECGARRVLADPGAVHLVAEADVKRLRALFRGELDGVPCEACGRPLGVRPTVAVIFNDSQEIYVVAGGDSDDLHRLLKARLLWAVADGSLQELGSLDELRATVGRRLVARVAALNPLFEAIAAGEDDRYTRGHWQELTSSVFAAAHVGLTVPLPGFALVGIPAREAPPVAAADVLELLALAQARVWAALSVSWITSGGHGPTLEGDLTRFVGVTELLPGAAEIASRELDRLGEAESTSSFDRYVIEAARASIWLAAGMPNPRAGAWAHLFFGHEVTCRLGGEEVPLVLPAMVISEERARATIEFEQAWDAVANAAVRHLDTDDYLRLLEQVAAKAGHPGLVEKVLTQGVHIEGSPEELTRGVMSWIELVPAETAIDHIGSFAQPLVDRWQADDLERVADKLLRKLGGGQEARARVEAWLGSCYKSLRMPSRFLERVSETPRSWEHELPLPIRARLWNERSNALRLAGRDEDALEIAEELVRLLLGSPHHHELRVAQRNAAILRRETGYPDIALKVLSDLLINADTEERIALLDSLAVTYFEVGRVDDALRCTEDALATAVGPFSRPAARLRVARAGYLAAVGRSAEALEALQQRSGAPQQVVWMRDNVDTIPSRPDPPHDASVVLVEVSVWITLLRRDRSIAARAAPQIGTMWEHLMTLGAEAEERGDAFVHVGALRGLALLATLLGRPDAEARWNLACDTATAYARTHRLSLLADPVALLVLARLAWERGDRETARRYLIGVPAALAAGLGGIRDLAVAAEAGLSIAQELDEFVQRVIPARLGRLRMLLGYFRYLDASVWPDIRLVAEIGRDVVGRSRILRRRADEAAPLADGLSDAAVARLAPRHGSVGIFEWVARGRYVLPFMTRISADGRVRSHWLPTRKNLDLSALSRRIRTRVLNWRTGRTGDPFDLPEWRTLERWVLMTLALSLERGDHVVFIEQANFTGLPWHVTVAPMYTASYAPSWATLLSLGTGQRPTSVGVVMVPRFNESSEVLAALEESVCRTEAFARTREFQLALVRDEAADHAGFARVMTGTEVAKLLCHGFVSVADGEVALMLAHEGALPLAHAVASASPVGREHRLSWRHCQSLPAAPRIVFSAACSTGVSHTAGLGERLGLFGALRHVGTAAVVAPRWDIVPSAVLPILDEALERHMGDGEPLALALHRACAAANAVQPRWLAWALAVEGDWR